jgi:hypothetical protein
VLLERRELPRREAGAMERAPEAIARASEVMADRRGVQARIDADEENVEPVCDDVPDALPARGVELRACRTPWDRYRPFVSPFSRRVLFTVAPAIRFAVASERPRSFSLSLTCSYWRSRFALHDLGMFAPPSGDACARGVPS